MIEMLLQCETLCLKVKIRLTAEEQESRPNIIGAGSSLVDLVHNLAFHSSTVGIFHRAACRVQKLFLNQNIAGN